MEELQKEVKNKLIAYSKRQLLESEKYRGRRDLISALLKDDKKYTCKEVDDLINKFLKGRVN